MTRTELLQIAKPILFNTEMVKAILEGRKTVTRRVVKHDVEAILSSPYHKEHQEVSDKQLITKLCIPPYQEGGYIYVRETWSEWTDGYVYKAWSSPFPQHGKSSVMKWHPSLHMPKDAARIFLKVKNVRVERLQEITPKEIEKEGLANPCKECYAKRETCEDCICRDESVDKMIWSELWNSTIKKADIALYGWDVNPYVWVIEFERIETDCEV